MKLELASFNVKEVAFSSSTRLESGVLSINKKELEAFLRQDDNIKEVQVELALPGEKTRIVHALDIIEPRIKVEGRGSIFPGFLGPPKVVGEGRTHRLAGVAVVEASELPPEERGLFFARERVIDMSGPGASYSPFSRTLNVVLCLQPKPGVSQDDYESAVRLAGLKAARYLAEATRQVEPDHVELFQFSKKKEDLPNVAYIYQVTSTGPLTNTFLYGEKVGRLFPTLIHPNETMDGALVSGNYTPHFVPTYVHMNNPVIRELFRFDGKELHFTGVILTYGGGLNATSFLKERAAYHAAMLARFLKADGTVLTQEAGGNSIMDQMLICQACEELGIKTSLVSYEMSGYEGTDPPLIYVAKEADAIISTGNREERVRLPAMKRVLGGKKILYTQLDASQEFELVVEEIASSIDQAGSNTMTARAF